MQLTDSDYEFSLLLERKTSELVIVFLCNFLFQSNQTSF